MLEALIILLTLNYILDYPLQGDFLAKFKSEKNYILFVHSMIWAGGLSSALIYLNMFEWWKFGMLLVGHILIDFWKCRGYYKKLKISDWNSLYIDQSFHVLQILICLI